MSTEIKKEEVIEKKQSTEIKSQEPKSKKKKSLDAGKLEEISGGEWQPVGHGFRVDKYLNG